MSPVRRAAVLGVALLAAACTSGTEGTASPRSSQPASPPSSSSSPPPSSGGMFLDASAVEEAISGQFEEREGVALDLSCDQRMAVEFGAEYQCEGTTADGEDVEILVNLTDDEGTFTWAEE